MESPFVSCIHKTMASVTECVFGTHPIDSLSSSSSSDITHKKTKNVPTNRHKSSSSSISRIVIFFENTLNCFVVVTVVAVGLRLVLVFDV